MIRTNQNGLLSNLLNRYIPGLRLARKPFRYKLSDMLGIVAWSETIYIQISVDRFLRKLGDNDQPGRTLKNDQQRI